MVYRVPDQGDTKERAVCPACHTMHDENRLNVVGTVPYWGDEVLLCKRNIEPLEHYFADRRNRNFGIHILDMA